MADPLYDTRQAAEYLSVSKSYLDILRCQGGGPEFIKLSCVRNRVTVDPKDGRMIRYRRSALDAWIDSHGTRRNTSQPEPDPVKAKKSLSRLRLNDQHMDPASVVGAESPNRD